MSDEAINVDMTMDQMNELLDPIPDGEQAEVQLVGIMQPGEDVKAGAPAHALFKVVNNPTIKYNGKMLRYPLFGENLARLVRFGQGQVAWHGGIDPTFRHPERVNLIGFEYQQDKSMFVPVEGTTVTYYVTISMRRRIRKDTGEEVEENSIKKFN